jgi:hypothetical protein
VLQVCETEMPVTHERVDTTGSSDDDMWVSVLVAEQLDVLLNRGTSVENTNPDIGKELGETVVFVSNLVRQLTCVAHDEDGRDTWLGLLIHLLERSKDKDCGLSETRLGLAEDVIA